MIPELNNKDIDPNVCVEKIYKNPGLIDQYLDGLNSKNETYRYNCFKVMNVISEKKPDILYPHWNFLENHLRSDNQYHKMSATIIIANLTAVDKDEKFEKLFDEYYKNLASEKTITPIYVVKSSSKIINAKPHLEKKITNILLNIEKIYTGKQVELV